jgi:SAM-dependent methyltransferase
MLPRPEGGGDAGAVRARLYARLPMLESDRWWRERAIEAPGKRVLELGAGTGRLATAMAATGVEVTAVERDPAMVAQLRRRAALTGGHVEVVEADAAALPPPVAGGFGLVVLASSLLNETGDAQTRQDLLLAARRACRRDGHVALQVLGPWWLEGMPAQATGELAPMAGGPAVTVDIERRRSSASTGRRRARLTYRFPDGEVLVDELDAEVITPAGLEQLLADAGLRTTGRWGPRPPDPVGAADPVRFLLARPR